MSIRLIGSTNLITTFQCRNVIAFVITLQSYKVLQGPIIGILYNIQTLPNPQMDPNHRCQRSDTLVRPTATKGYKPTQPPKPLTYQYTLDLYKQGVTNVPRPYYGNQQMACQYQLQQSQDSPPWLLYQSNESHGPEGNSPYQANQEVQIDQGNTRNEVLLKVVQSLLKEGVSKQQTV